VFDSGVGGLTVVRALRAALPGEDIVYLGDTARVPYGSKSPRTVERYSLACQRFLLAHRVKLIVVACNTASANALPALADAAAVPVVGAVDPGAATALARTRSRRIGVIGTLSTVRSRAYERAIQARAADAAVTALACPLLVPLAEEGWTDDPVAEAVCERYLAALLARDPAIDTLVLGCTHYPLLAPAIERACATLRAGPVAVVDSASAMAAAAREHLGARAAAGDGALHCYVTDASRLDELAPRFLGAPLSGFELVDL
jgi:glutamate racemase